MTPKEVNQHDLRAQARLRSFLDEVFQQVFSDPHFEVRLKQAMIERRIEPRLFRTLAALASRHGGGCTKLSRSNGELG